MSSPLRSESHSTSESSSESQEHPFLAENSAHLSWPCPTPINDEDARVISNKYGLCVVVPTKSSQAFVPPDGFIALSETFLDYGVRFPLNNFFRSVLNSFDIALYQLSPNGWAHMIGLFVLFTEQGLGAPTLEEFLWFYALVSLPPGNDYYCFAKRNDPGVRGIVDLVDSVKPWRRTFFLIRISGIRGTFAKAIMLPKPRLSGKSEARCKQISELSDSERAWPKLKRTFEITACIPRQNNLGAESRKGLRIPRINVPSRQGKGPRIPKVVVPQPTLMSAPESTGVGQQASGSAVVGASGSAAKLPSTNDRGKCVMVCEQSGKRKRGVSPPRLIENILAEGCCTSRDQSVPKSLAQNSQQGGNSSSEMPAPILKMASFATEFFDDEFLGRMSIQERIENTFKLALKTAQLATASFESYTQSNHISSTRKNEAVAAKLAVEQAHKQREELQRKYKDLEMERDTLIEDVKSIRAQMNILRSEMTKVVLEKYDLAHKQTEAITIAERQRDQCQAKVELLEKSLAEKEKGMDEQYEKGVRGCLYTIFSAHPDWDLRSIAPWISGIIDEFTSVEAGPLNEFEPVASSAALEGPKPPEEYASPGAVDV